MDEYLKVLRLKNVEILRMTWQMTEALIFFFLNPHLLFGTPQLNWPKKGPGPSWQIKKEFSSKIQRKDEKCLIWTYCSVEPSQLWLIWFDLIWFDLIWFDLNLLLSGTRRTMRASPKSSFLRTSKKKFKQKYPILSPSHKQCQITPCILKKSSITQIQLPPHIFLI